MARKSLRPHHNQIRAWAREGRTDAWIAHQLDVTVQQIISYKRENDLAAEDGDGNGVAIGEEIDLRAEDDAAIAAELEEAEAARAEAEAAAAAAEQDDNEDEDGGAAGRRRRGRRGGRRRKAGPRTLEGTFDHGEEGYGLWLDPAVADDPIYAEHWAGHRPVEITVDEDQIVIRRTGDDDD